MVSLFWLACGDSGSTRHGMAADAGVLVSPGAPDAAVGGGAGTGGSQDANAGDGAGGSGDAGAGTPRAGTGAVDAGSLDAAASPTERRFALASAGTQLRIDGPRVGLQLTEANLADDVDLVAVHQEFYGVPWQALVDDVPPPAEWSAQMQALANQAHAVSDRSFLSISMLDLVALNGPQCNTVIAADDAEAAAYLGRVLADADRIPLELVTWWSNRDLLPSGLMTNCPCDYDPTWCQVVDVFRNAGGDPLVPASAYFGEILLKAFGTMGIRDYDGHAKPALADLWAEARSRPLAR